MKVINEEEKLGQEEKNPVMPFEDAQALYEAQLSSNRQFFVNATQKGDSVGDVFLSSTQKFKQSIERIPTGLRIYWGQGDISQAAVQDWAFGLMAKPALMAAGVKKEYAGVLEEGAKEFAKEITGSKKMRSRGEQLITTANRSLEMLNEQHKAEEMQLKEAHPVLDSLFSTGEQYGAAMLMAFVPAIGPALSLSYISSLEASGTAIEGLEQYKQQHPEDKDLKGFIGDEKSVKEWTLNTLKTFVNGVGEYILGPVGQARHRSKMAELAARGFRPAKYGALKYVGKEMLKGAASEYAEEGLIQGTTDTVFDYLLGRYKDKDEAIMAWKENLVQAGYAALFGGVFGMGGALYDRAKGINATKELLKDVVPAQDLDKVATAVFENELNNVMDVATVGLEISSQLNTQKGEIYDAFRNAAFQAMKESGGYKGLTDESLWSHANEVAERFSQEAVAEAFKRKVPIQEVIDSHDIVYKDGELHFAKTEQSKLSDRIKKVYAAKKQQKPTSLLQFIIQNGGVKDSGGELKAMDAQKQRIGLVNNKYGMDLDRAREMAAEAGYFGGNPTDDIANTTVADFLDLIDKELRGNKVYTPEAQNQVIAKEAEQDTDEAENFYERKLEEYGVDYSDMTFEQKEQAYSELLDMENKENMPSDDELEKIFGTEESGVSQEDLDELANMWQESYDLKEEMDAIDANNDAYTGETININGVEKTVYNSNGDRIAQSAEALQAFYNWFGDSKVVDENGRPLVVYHGSKANNIEVFDVGLGTNGLAYGNGVYFSRNKILAESNYGKNVYNVYLREQNPFFNNSSNSKEMEKLFNAVGEEYKDGDTISKITNKNEEQTYKAKEITKALKSMGYDGVIFGYNNNPSKGIEYVAFDPNQIKSTSNRGTYSLTDNNIYNQVQGLGKNAPVRRGSFDANSKVIKLFENANTSTLPHELAHYWLDNMWNYAKSGNANPQYVAQFNAVKNFLGVKPDQENLTRAQHEKFASAYEKYLYRGEFPTPIMGTVFANYERFIRDVYQSINDIRAQGKSKVRLTPEIIQFFDSMTSGELPTDLATTEMLNETRAEEVHQYDSKVVETVKKEVVPPESAPVVAPEATPQEILPVGSSGEVAESRLAKRTAESMGMESDLQYERANIEQERAKAAEMWKNDPQKAQAELNNATMGNEVLRNALYTEQQRIALENGDRDTFLKSLRKQSAEATRAGQELAALRGVVEDITMPSYWIRLAEWEAQKQLAKNMATYFDKVMGNTPLLNFTQKFDADVKALYEKVRKAETNAEKSKIMKEGLDEMKKTYRGLNQQEVGELFQTDWTNEELAYDYVEKKARDAVGLNLTNEKANAIIQASRDLDKLSRNVDEFGLPTAQFFAKKSELEYLINSHTPSSQTKVLLSTLGRANMLTAPATSVLNVASNVQNYGAQTLVRRLNNTITGHTNDNLVDSNLRKQYRKRVWDTFWATGYDLSMMNSIADTRLYRGESAVNSAGEGVIRQAGQWAEKHIFGELISSPDMVFKSYLAFTDFAGNEATDIAYKEGLTGDKAKARANELFTDAVKIEPKTEIGKQIRAKAQADALVITFQQDTKLARALLDLRNIVNKATGDVGVGDLLSAFVKTPANVLALGYDATVGPFGHLVNTFGAIQDARAGNLTSARVMATIRQTTTMAVMQAIVAAFALGFIDDDDYIPDYSQLSPSERLIVKERGASFGSIRIGDTYISTDFFGPFEVPLTAWLNARRQQGFADSASAYIGSVLRKGLDAPVIKDLLDQAKAAENVGSDSLSIWEHIYDTAGNLLISRLTPNVMNTLAKMTDDYERETNKSVLNKLIARVPVARKTLAPKMSVSTGKPVETPSALMQLLFGSRAHKLVDSTVSNELYRLYQAGERATISDITRSGDLKLIDEKEKQSAKEWFAREYSKAAERAIKTSTYRRKSDEDKKDELNKIRRDLVKQLKEKYKKKISVAKQKK